MESAFPSLEDSTVQNNPPKKKKPKQQWFRFQRLTARPKVKKHKQKKTQPLKVFTINSGLRCSLDGTRLSTKETPTQQKLMVSDFQSLGLLRSRPQKASSLLRWVVRWMRSTTLLLTFQAKAGTQHSCDYFVSFNCVFYCILLGDIRQRSVSKLRNCLKIRSSYISIHFVFLHCSVLIARGEGR